MAENGQIELAGQFPVGVVVHLWRVAHEGVMRHEGGDLVDTKRVGDDGRLVFRSRVVPGDRYIAFGYVDGQPVQVRARGLADGEVSGLGQAPVQADVVRHADGQRVEGVYTPRADQREPARVEDDDEDASEDEGSSEPEVLKGAALQDRIKELGLEGTASMSADEKRAAVADAEQGLAAASNTNDDEGEG